MHRTTAVQQNSTYLDVITNSIEDGEKIKQNKIKNSWINYLVSSTRGFRTRSITKRKFTTAHLVLFIFQKCLQQ